MHTDARGVARLGTLRLRECAPPGLATSGSQLEETTQAAVARCSRAVECELVIAAEDEQGARAGHVVYSVAVTDDAGRMRATKRLNARHEDLLEVKRQLEERACACQVGGDDEARSG